MLSDRLFFLGLFASIGIGLLACNRSGSKGAGVGDEATPPPVTAEHPKIPVSLECQGPGSPGYQLHLLVDRQGLANVESVLKGGAFVGQLTDSRMQEADTYNEQILKRAEEINRVADCLGERVKNARIPDFRFQLPKITPPRIDNEWSPPPVRKEPPLAQYWAQMVADLEAALAASNWEQAQRLFAKLHVSQRVGDAEGASTILKVPPEIKAAFQSLRAKYGPNGVLLCDGQYDPHDVLLKGGDVPIHYFKAILNRTCYLEGSPAQRMIVRRLAIAMMMWTPDTLDEAWQKVGRVSKAADVSRELSDLLRSKGTYDEVARIIRAVSTSDGVEDSPDQDEGAVLREVMILRYGPKDGPVLAAWIQPLFS